MTEHRSIRSIGLMFVTRKRYLNLSGTSTVLLIIIIKNTDISKLNTQCVLALLMSVVRADRFCEGVLYEFFKNGCILRWLERLEGME